MNDFVTRARNALERITANAEEGRHINGLLGRLNSDGSTTFTPVGLPRHKFVRIRNSSGSQTTIVARDDAGVPESSGLAVRLRVVHSVPNSGVVVYAIVGIVRDDALATMPAPPPGGVPPHTHDTRYYQKTEHVNVSVGAADAGKPIVLDAGGKLDATFIDSEDIADIVGAMVTGNTETDIAVTYQDADNTLDFVVSSTLVADRITAAATDDTIADADLWGYVTGGVLVKTAWSNIKAVLKTYFDTLYNLFTTEDAQDAVGTILTDTATIDFTYADATPAITADVKDDSITFAKMQNIATERLLGRATAGTGDIELIILTAFARSLIDDVDAAAGRATLGLGTMATQAEANYALLAGRAGGQSLNGGNAANEDLTLEGTAHATKTSSQVFIQPNGGNMGIGTSDVENWHSTLRAIQLGGGSAIMFNATISQSYWIDNAYYDGVWKRRTAAEASYYSQSAGNHNFFYAPTGAVDSAVAAWLVGMHISALGVGIGTLTPQGKLHVHDGTSGKLFVTKTAVVNVSQTIIPDGTGDVTKLWRGRVIVDNGGAIGFDIEVTNGGNQDVVVGGGTWRFAVSAAGAFTVIRQSGAGSANITLDGTWQ